MLKLESQMQNSVIHMKYSFLQKKSKGKDIF